MKPHSASQAHYDILKADPAVGSSTWRYVKLYRALSPTAQEDLCCVLASIVNNMHQIAWENGQRNHGMGAVGALELVYKLVQKGYL